MPSVSTALLDTELVLRRPALLHLRTQLFVTEGLQLGAGVCRGHESALASRVRHKKHKERKNLSPALFLPLEIQLFTSKITTDQHPPMTHLTRFRHSESDYVNLKQHDTTT
jgi:hypothetical protein